MSKIIQVFALICFFVEIINAQPMAPESKQWQKVEELSDEFDFWDDSKWVKSLWNYGVPVQMRKENSGVANGKLWIKATLDKGAERWFESSRVMSKTQISYPMYTECKMKAANISAFNTFWMNNGDSKNRDEIDMCENNPKPSLKSKKHFAHTMNSQYFVVENNKTVRKADNFNNRKLSKKNPLRGVKWNEAYHTIGVWWKDATHIQFYLNGEKAGSVVAEKDFTRDLNIIWDLWSTADEWVGGIANKKDLLDDKINTMYVDWIHTYKLVDNK